MCVVFKTHILILTHIGRWIHSIYWKLTELFTTYIPKSDPNMTFTPARRDVNEIQYSTVHDEMVILLMPQTQ